MQQLEPSYINTLEISISAAGIKAWLRDGSVGSFGFNEVLRLCLSQDGLSAQAQWSPLVSIPALH